MFCTVFPVAYCVLYCVPCGLLCSVLCSLWPVVFYTVFPVFLLQDPNTAACSCKAELMKLSETVAANVASLKCYMAGISSKVDRVYAAINHSRPSQVRLASATSSSQSSDTDSAVRDEPGDTFQ